jgi:hypothetical protein
VIIHRGNALNVSTRVVDVRASECPKSAEQRD